MESLEVCILLGCSRLKKFPEIVGNMSHLLELYLDKTTIKDLPLEHLTGLIKLDLRECKNLSSLPNAICYLKSLKTLLEAWWIARELGKCWKPDGARCE